MSPEDAIANWEIFLWALEDLGGAATLVDVEDIFIRCFEAAPRRFAWRTRIDLPDYKKCSKALQEAEARSPRMLVKAGSSFRRQLTVEGQTWLEANRARLGGVLESGKLVQEPKQRPRARLLSEVEQSDVFQAWKAEGTVPSEKWRVAELLRCSPDSDMRIWSDRLQILRSAAHIAERSEILSFLEELMHLHPGWFGEERA
jgi:hypothetical protein